jgi:dihydrofolate reductase
MPELTILVAMTESRVIGHNGDMPWGRSLPSDLRRFRERTMGHSLIMGRKTFPTTLKDGRALPGRRSVVLTRSQQEAFPIADAGGVPALDPISAVLAGWKRDAPEIFVIGGASVYEYYVSYARRLDITWVHAELPGDTFFPRYNLFGWRRKDSECLPRGRHDPRDAYETSHEVLYR